VGQSQAKTGLRGKIKMKKTIFLVALACLLAGCSGKGPTAMKLKTETNVTSEQGLPVRVMAHDEKPLPIRMVPDEIIIGAFIASLIAVFATTFAAIAAWRAASNSRRAVEEHLKHLKTNLKE
jgi:ABC-type antimicrobial peptide transport system permease subunit